MLTAANYSTDTETHTVFTAFFSGNSYLPVDLPLNFQSSVVKHPDWWSRVILESLGCFVKLLRIKMNRN